MTSKSASLRSLILPGQPAPTYRDRLDYLSSRPRYYFGGLPANLYAARRLQSMAEASGNSGRVLTDLGAGPGEVWDHLSPLFHRIVGVEPNIAMWSPDYPSNCEYIQECGFEYLTSGRVPQGGAVAWMWSLNYALLSYFERYNVELRQVDQVADQEQAALQAEQDLEAALDMTRTCSWFVAFFDDDTAEQQLVTRFWSRDTPYPFNDRAYTRQLFERVASSWAQRNDLQFITTHERGLADYGQKSEALSRFMTFQFRGHFDDDLKVIEELKDELSAWDRQGSVQIPAGSYFYEIRTPQTFAAT